MRTISWLLLTLMGLASVAGCSEDNKDATEIVITAQTDLVVGSEFTGLAIRVYRPDAVLPRDAESFISQREVRIAGPLDLQKPIVIAKGERDEMLVAVRALGPGGWSSQVVEHVVRARFMPGKSIAIPVFLAAACRQSTCAAAGQTCYGETHGMQCPGACAPIAEPDFTIEVNKAGDELAWSPRRYCPGDGGMDAGDGSVDDGSVEDASDANLDAAGDASDSAVDSGPDASEAGVCKPTVPGAICDHVKQCGCPDGLACQINSKIDDAGAAVVACVMPAYKKTTEVCTDNVQCSAGNHCLFYASLDDLAWCHRYCAEANDCGGGSKCIPLRNEGKPVVGFSTCQPSCAVDGDCGAGQCCWLSMCAPKAACEAETPICMPSFPWNGNSVPPVGSGGCTSDSDCCPTSGRTGLCLTTSTQDGGAGGASRCMTSCTKSSDCASGCCSAPLVNASNARVCMDTTVAAVDPTACGSD